MSIPSRSRLRSMWRFHKWLWKVSGGRLGRSIGGMDVLELTSIGHRSGEPRSVLLYYIDSPRGPMVVASNAGHTSDPAWAKNLRANPEATVNYEGDNRSAHAVFLVGTERQDAFDRFAQRYDDYSTYNSMTDREIPVVLLEVKRVGGD